MSFAKFPQVQLLSFSAVNALQMQNLVSNSSHFNFKLFHLVGKLQTLNLKNGFLNIHCRYRVSFATGKSQVSIKTF